MVVKLRAARILMRIQPRRRGVAQGGARNQEFQELRRRIEELKN